MKFFTGQVVFNSQEPDIEGRIVSNQYPVAQEGVDLRQELRKGGSIDEHIIKDIVYLAGLRRDAASRVQQRFVALLHAAALTCQDPDLDYAVSCARIDPGGFEIEYSERGLGERSI